MKDIPLFTAQGGVGSVTLREIPYTGRAYILVHGASDADAFLHECADFCRAAGAREILAAGESVPEEYPVAVEIVTMAHPGFSDRADAVKAVPVTPETLPDFIEIYNRRMAGVPNAAYWSKTEGEKMLTGKKAYYFYREDTLLGIGIASPGKIDAVASVCPGSGQALVLALAKELSMREVRLEVAADNAPAMRLYRRMGFAPTGEKTRWRVIFPLSSKNA